jgi:hypothetical protein
MRGGCGGSFSQPGEERERDEGIVDGRARRGAEENGALRSAPA